MMTKEWSVTLRLCGKREMSRSIKDGIGLFGGGGGGGGGGIDSSAGGDGR